MAYAAASPIPTSMAALGDSLTAGFAADGAAERDDAASWSTGSSPAVNSHYLRLLARTPYIAGRVANHAVPGARMADLVTQAETAVRDRAYYVTVWAGTDDVCAAAPAQMTPPDHFASSLRSVLQRLTQGVPGAHVLVVSIPDWVGLWKQLAGSPAARAAWARYTDRCPVLLNPAGGEAERAAVAERIRELNAVIDSLCRDFVGCATDAGAVFSLWPSLEETDLAFDLFHLSESGQAKVAEATWNAGPCAPPPQPSCPHAAPPVLMPLQSGSRETIGVQARGDEAVVRAHLFVDQVSRLQAELRRKADGVPIALLPGSVLGSSRSGRLRHRIYAQAVGPLAVRLRVLRPRRGPPAVYRLVVEATSLDGLRSRLSLPVRLR